MLLPSRALWQALGACARHQLRGVGREPALGLGGLGASEGAGRGVQPVQESSRTRKKGSLCVIALVGCKQDSPWSRQPLSAVVSMMVGVCGRTPHGHVRHYIPTAQAVPPASSHGPSPPDPQSDTRPAGFLNLLLLSTSHRRLSGPTVSSPPARVSLPSPRPAEARPCHGSTSMWRPAATQGGPLRAPSSPGSPRSSQHVLRDVEAGRATSLHGAPPAPSLCLFLFRPRAAGRGGRCQPLHLLATPAASPQTHLIKCWGEQKRGLCDLPWVPGPRVPSENPELTAEGAP